MATIIRTKPNGPLIVTGDFEVFDVKGQKNPQPLTEAHLCRCGASKNKPYCDGSHHRIGFKDE